MINNAKFSKRLKKVLEYYQLSASSFAEKIQVQRSSISHLLSGRNKPSLDFVLKVLKEFKEVELYWLLNGEGNFPKEEKKTDFPTTLFSENPKIESKSNNPIIAKSNPQNTISENPNSQKSSSENLEKEIISNPNFSKSEIERIVVFYKNGSFKNYTEI